MGAVCSPHVIHASRSAQEVGGEVEHGGGGGEGAVGNGGLPGGREFDEGQEVGTAVFLVAGHQLEKTRIVGAGRGHRAVEVADECGSRVEHRRVEAGVDARIGQFGNDTAGYAGAMAFRRAFLEQQFFEGVADGVTEIQNAPQTAFSRVGGDDALLL